MNIYLSGKIPKGDEIGSLIDWRDQITSRFRPHDSVSFITPVCPDLDERDPRFVVGFVVNAIKNADIVYVDGSKYMGVGTSQELLIAKYYKKYVITYLPLNSPHRKKNLKMYGVNIEDWIHPFIILSSDIIFDNIDDSISFIKSASLDRHTLKAKGIDFLDQLINPLSAK